MRCFEPARLADLPHALVGMLLEFLQLLRASRFWYFRFRWARRSKSTGWASNSGPSTQANCAPACVTTRQPPHIPVPSTINEFRLTTVGMPCGRVVSATACIIRIGPIARTRSIASPAAIIAFSGSITNPLTP